MQQNFVLSKCSFAFIKNWFIWYTNITDSGTCIPGIVESFSTRAPKAAR